MNRFDDQRERFPVAPPNCYDCVHQQWQGEGVEPVCELGEEPIEDGTFAEECEDFRYAWDDEQAKKRLETK